MVGRKVISTNRFMTQEELLDFMLANWDKERYGTPIISRVNDVSPLEYITLPINEHFLCFIYPIKKNLFHKTDGIVVCSYDYTLNMQDAIRNAAIRQVSPLYGIIADRESRSKRKEQKTIVEDVLIEYYEYLSKIVEDNGLLFEEGPSRKRRK